MSNNRLGVTAANGTGKDPWRLQNRLQELPEQHREETGPSGDRKPLLWTQNGSGKSPGRPHYFFVCLFFNLKQILHIMTKIDVVFFVFFYVSVFYSVIHHFACNQKVQGFIIHNDTYFAVDNKICNTEKVKTVHFSKARIICKIWSNCRIFAG